jgi:alpha-mannosidase
MREGTAAMYPETPGSQCLGPQVFEYAFIPYSAENSRDAQALADAFLYPPTAQRIKPAGGGTPMPDIPWIWDAPNVWFSCFKRSWDGKAYILRFYEAEGKQTDLDLQLSAFSSAALCTMEEKPVKILQVNKGHVTITLKPYEIASLLLEC